ncbi:MAG: membrane protein of unknown function [Promethearchaeota archaeon]|nr:MAG: membrane protein of unknown function [Candidatus Lokiarchaeota archaeon]
MNNSLLFLYGFLSIFIGLGPAVIYALKKFGTKRENWISWTLGGLFWFIAYLCRLPILYFLNTSTLHQWIIIYSATALAGIFETLFRIILFLSLINYTADKKGKVIMSGLGWGTIEAFILHTLAIISLMFLPNDDPTIVSLEGYEIFLLFGGIERLITEIFHILLMILVFYGIKSKLQGISYSNPLRENFFTKYPKPEWILLIIVGIIHFLYDLIAVSLVYVVDLITLYIILSILVGILYSYVSNRMRSFPLFPEEYK